MKIHIVQKGDTLWEISNKYGVDFEQVKQLNSHLSSPDMIMPGMKIKIPSSSKAVKQESMPLKETAVKQPYKDISPKPLPVIKEDDKEKQKAVKPEMPVQPMPQMPQIPTQPIMQMPILEQEFQNYTTINFPEMPQQPEPKKELPKKEIEQPKAQPMPLPQPMPSQMVPMCCHFVHPCYPPVQFPVMAHVTDGFVSPAHMAHPSNGNMMEFQGPPPTMEMPMQTAGKKDCGCQGTGSFNHSSKQPNMYGNVTQDYNEQHTFNPQYQMPPANLYPPQYGNDMMSNQYPTPPGYPDFSGFNNREEEDEKKGE